MFCHAKIYQFLVQIEEIYDTKAALKCFNRTKKHKFIISTFMILDDHNIQKLFHLKHYKTKITILNIEDKTIKLKKELKTMKILISFYNRNYRYHKFF